MMLPTASKDFTWAPNQREDLLEMKKNEAEGGRSFFLLLDNPDRLAPPLRPDWNLQVLPQVGQGIKYILIVNVFLYHCHTTFKKSNNILLERHGNYSQHNQTSTDQICCFRQISKPENLKI